MRHLQTIYTKSSRLRHFYSPSIILRNNFSTMSSSKLFTVFGATGNQGSSIINSILNHPQLSQEYKLRGITRNVSSDKAKALTDRGVEMVSADLEDSDSVSKAIAGSYAVFGVTNYWEMPSKEREIKQGKRIADASKEHGVKQLIWSSLPNVTKLSGGKYSRVEHFDSKAEVAEYIATLSIPHVLVVPGFFMTNLKGSIRKDAEKDEYTLSFPFPSSVKIPYFHPGVDTGNFVAGALSKPESFTPGENGNPTTILEASGFWIGDEVAEFFKTATGKTLNYFQTPEDLFLTFFSTPEVGKEMLENMLLIRDYGYFGPDVEKAFSGLDESIKDFTVQEPQDFVKFLEGNRW